MKINTLERIGQKRKILPVFVLAVIIIMIIIIGLAKGNIQENSSAEKIDAFRKT